MSLMNPTDKQSHTHMHTHINKSTRLFVRGPGSHNLAKTSVSYCLSLHRISMLILEELLLLPEWPRGTDSL